MDEKKSHRLGTIASQLECHWYRITRYTFYAQLSKHKWLHNLQSNNKPGRIHDLLVD